MIDRATQSAVQLNLQLEQILASVAISFNNERYVVSFAVQQEQAEI